MVKDEVQTTAKLIADALVIVNELPEAIVIKYVPAGKVVVPPEPALNAFGENNNKASALREPKGNLVTPLA